MGVFVALLACAVTSAAADDYSEACIRQLRRVVISQRDGTHLPRLFALRQLDDPTLRPLFYQLAQRQEWQVQVHAILGLAEIDSSHRVDPWLVTQVDELAQEVLIANAIDMDLIGLEQVNELLAWTELQPMPRLLLMGELLLAGENPERETLSRLALSANLRIAGLASLFLAQLGENSALGAYNDRLAVLAGRERDRHMLWLLEAVRQYSLTAALAWVKQSLEGRDSNDDLAYWGALTVLALDPQGGVAIWNRLLGPTPTYRDQVKFGMLLLAAGTEVPSSAYERLTDDSELIRRMVDVGRRLSANEDTADELIALLDLGHLRTAKWAMGILPDLPAEQATKVCLHLIDSVGDGNPGQADRISMAIEAVAKLSELAPDQAYQRLSAVKDDSLSQEVILLGLFESSAPEAGAAARSLRRIGAGRADSLALLLMARHADSLDGNDLRQLGMIAAGGGRVSEGLQIQAAWLYLNHTDAIDQSLGRVFEESP